LENKEFKHDYECFYEGLRTNNKTALKFNVLFLVRRYTIALIFVVMPTFRLCNMAIFVIWTFITFSFLITDKPFDKEEQNTTEKINEGVVFIVTYLCFTFLDPKYSRKFVKQMGWIYISICSLSIIYNLSQVLLTSIYEMKDNWKSKREKR